MKHLSPTLPLRLPSLTLGRLTPALSHRQWGVVAAAAAIAIGAATWDWFRRRLTPEEVERLRRVFLARQGRITDAMLLDFSFGNDLTNADGTPSPDAASSADRTEGLPSILRYQYRIAGVTYECAQDVSLLGDRVRHLRMDLPVQVRYDPQNPTNSIVVAEVWSGLRQG